MPYLIDGHNLIPKLPGLSLADVDDEERLLTLLQTYARLRQRKIEVYFDNAPPGQPRRHSYGLVTACFVPQGRSADEAIRSQLARLSREASSWTVVTSDRSVTASARQMRARVQSSEAFAQELMTALAHDPSTTEKPADAPLAEAEVQNWLALFRSRKGGR